MDTSDETPPSHCIWTPNITLHTVNVYTDTRQDTHDPTVFCIMFSVMMDTYLHLWWRPFSVAGILLQIYKWIALDMLIWTQSYHEGSFVPAYAPKVSPPLKSHAEGTRLYTQFHYRLLMQGQSVLFPSSFNFEMDSDHKATECCKFSWALKIVIICLLYLQFEALSLSGQLIYE